MAQILVVDDSSTVRNEVGDFLKANGLSVASAVDGKDGLDKLKSDSAIKLVISDVNMPNMDGLELIRQVRALPQYKFKPILMLTTESQAEKKQAGKAAGATGWIVKPFTQEQLVAVVNKVLR